jgi:subtilisin family serine protease
MLKTFHLLTRISLLMGLLSLTAWAEDRYVVHLGRHDAYAVAARHGMTVVKSLKGSGTGVHVLSAPKNSESWKVMQELANDAAVQSAEKDSPVLLPGIKAAAMVHPASAAAPAFPLDGTLTLYYRSLAANGYINQPAASLIKVSDAHKQSAGQGTVAVLDTGIDSTQPVLAGSVAAGWDFVHNNPGGQEVADTNQETTPILDQETTPILDQETTPILDGGSAIILDQETTPILDQETTPILDQETTPILDATKFPAYGHGTMVAGLIHLVAPQAMLMPVKVFAADGTATISQIVNGIYWAVDHNADVINMSFSTHQPSAALEKAIIYANSKGVICVASAGNDGLAEVVYPAAYSMVIDVASTNDNDVRSMFSNYGGQIALAAPGEAVITTYPGNRYAEVWGTSFSAPLVSGGAALLVGMGNNLTPAQARNALTQAVQIGQELGAGELNLLQAVTYLNKRGKGN